MKCKNCGKENEDGARFCNYCGSKLEAERIKMCTVCGTPLPEDAFFCSACGARQPEDTKKGKAKKVSPLKILLAIIALFAVCETILFFIPSTDKDSSVSVKEAVETAENEKTPENEAPKAEEAKTEAVDKYDLDIELTAISEAPTIISGRTYAGNRNNGYSHDDFRTASVKVSGTEAEKWFASGVMEFEIPASDEVKIVDAQFSKYNNLPYNAELNDISYISDDGHKLCIDVSGSSISQNYAAAEETSFVISLYISSSLYFTGDVYLSALNTDSEETIAYAVSPISLDSSTTNIDMGYEKFDVCDVTITEAIEGILPKGGEVKLRIGQDDFYGKELRFSDKSIEYSIDGELEIRNFTVKDGELSFIIDKPSYSEPSSITISNITLNCPYATVFGSFDLNIYGSAITNNYKENVEPCDKLYTGTISANEDAAYFDDNDSSGCTFENYVNINNK